MELLYHQVLVCPSAKMFASHQKDREGAGFDSPTGNLFLSFFLDLFLAGLQGLDDDIEGQGLLLISSWSLQLPNSVFLLPLVP